ncbi:hypothetical protein Psi01_83400 [Planobispora siamensis]|uniref:Repeat domain-containing protein n=1 Tax=Planobispora siamensis TaxID=936338 RepID=A0A8J3SQM6_9ACTN|nr:VCBS repeat-containing protein [Planobispora siamensis]GIH97710.1 hypothetical protein Psi01_83400 [Planobispora siamensis]
MRKFHRSLGRWLAAGFTLVLATLGLTAVDVAGIPRQAHAASSPNGMITRSEVLARAQNWVERNVRYNKTRGSATLITDVEGDNRYGPDCSGLVSMAWHITANAAKGGNSTSDFLRSADIDTLPSMHHLLPGDAILREGHMELFARWKNEADHSQGAWTYSLNGAGNPDGNGWENDWAKGPAVNSHGQRGDESWSSMTSQYIPVRYSRIVNDMHSKSGSDFNSDGIGDVFATFNGALYIWNGRGNNTFADAITYGAGWSAYSRPTAGDFNNDGRSDLAAIKDGVLHIWSGRGNNTFAEAIDIGRGWSPYAATLMTLGDVNRDGQADLGAVDGGALHIWNGRGNNTFADAIAIGRGWDPYFPH